MTKNLQKEIVIAGGSGFIGQALARHYRSQGHTVHILTRRPSKPGDVLWDGQTLGPWVDSLKKAKLLINLSGKSVDCRYTPANKAEILASRLDSTRVLLKALREYPHSIDTWLNASSATIYDHAVDRINTEYDFEMGSDFSMDVVQDWEAAFMEGSLEGVRRVALRMSIVLSTDGGALPKMIKIAKRGLGGKQGNGQQWVSWIGIADVLRAVDFIVAHPGLIGPVNITAPHPIRNRELMQRIRQHLGISWGMPTPAWLLQIGAWLIRTEPELILKSRNVYPEKLLATGFAFKTPTLDLFFE